MPGPWRTRCRRCPRETVLCRLAAHSFKSWAISSGLRVLRQHCLLSLPSEILHGVLALLNLPRKVSQGAKFPQRRWHVGKWVIEAEGGANTADRRHGKNMSWPMPGVGRIYVESEQRSNSIGKRILPADARCFCSSRSICSEPTRELRCDHSSRCPLGIPSWSLALLGSFELLRRAGCLALAPSSQLTLCLHCTLAFLL